MVVKKSVPFVQTVLLAGALSVVGCKQQPAEPTLAEQAANVRSGLSDRIVVEHTALDDSDLQEVSGLPNLRELLLDSADSHFSAAGVLQLVALPKLEHLRIRGTGINDAALKQLAACEHLAVLNLPQGAFGDAALVELKRLPNLVQFRFGSPRVTDAGMKALAELPAIKRLHLINVPITDVGLAELAKIGQLESLYIDGGDFSDAAMEQLFRERPKLHVHLNQTHHDLDPSPDAH
jgi:hypothetical protein